VRRDPLVSSQNPRIGEVDPTHLGPPDLILQEIVAPCDVPEEVRKPLAAQTFAGKGEGRGATWAEVTFAGRALALVEGTGQPDYDDYGDPLIWVFALSAESPVPGEAIVSVGGFASSSSETRYSKGEPPRRGKRVSFFSAIRTEPRGTPNTGGRKAGTLPL
jgi:hypothetical protein